jgi:hypothetical protein
MRGHGDATNRRGGPPCASIRRNRAKVSESVAPGVQDGPRIALNSEPAFERREEPSAPQPLFAGFWLALAAASEPR